MSYQYYWCFSFVLCQEKGIWLWIYQKENLFLLLDEFGENLLFEPEAGYTFSLDVTRKLDNIDYIKNNLDKPFTVYTDENGKQTGKSC